MKTTDVVAGTTPDAACWTMHVFAEPNPPWTPQFNTPAGNALHVPPAGERDIWPPQLLFDAVYASALISTWPTQDFLAQSCDAAKCKARVDSDNQARFDALLMLREGTHITDDDLVSQSPSTQQVIDDAREKRRGILRRNFSRYWASAVVLSDGPSSMHKRAQVSHFQFQRNQAGRAGKGVKRVGKLTASKGSMYSSKDTSLMKEVLEPENNRNAEKDSSK
ncbi:hypothetical protein F5146DRAFT_1001489 [Armillaria mellea]|nr:hypothetical protein F5146DRAFT_1001489 [Armillaria mellea]